MRPFDLAANDLGVAILIALVVGACIVIVQSPLPKSVRVLLVIALVLRVLGAISRYVVIMSFYGGVGDAVGYYIRGVYFSEFFLNLDWTPITDSQHWWGGRWWGTTPMFWFSAAAVAVIGQTMLGEFILFSLLSFVGLAGFVMAFRRSFPTVPIHRYARWVWLFPSLWFWPASVGKEAVVLFGLGLSVMGFIGKRDRIHWTPLMLGMGVVFLIRPQLAALFLLVAFMSYWLGRGGRWTPGKTLQSIVIAVGSIAVIWVGLSMTGMESFDLEGVQEYVEADPGRTAGGGGAIEAPDIGLTGLPLAFVNVLLRPFPWEASSIMVLASSLEILVLWGLILTRRRRLIQTLRGWRSSRLLRLSAAFFFVYTVSVGMVVANLGIISRQRIFLFPFLFVFFEAVAPAVQRYRRPPHPAMRGYPPPAGARPGWPSAGVGPGGAGWPAQKPPGRSSSR
jgi:hypothetical protein